jgi:hypothetical protein
MVRMFVLVSLIAVQLGEAASPCATVAPAPVGYTTTPAISCNTPLCQGLVGAGAGAAGLAIIGGIAAAAAHKNEPQTTPPIVIPPVPPTKPPVVITTNPILLTLVVTTAEPSIFNREKDDEESGSSWLLPLLGGLLLLCCLLGLLGYFCMKGKRATKVKKTKKAAPAVDRGPAIAPQESVPLMTGHWEQPKQIVPVTTAQKSFVPQVTTASVAMAAPTMVETVAPSYSMMAPAYTAAVAPTMTGGLGGGTTAMAYPAVSTAAVAPQMTGVVGGTTAMGYPAVSTGMVPGYSAGNIV